jgi:release factor glutamine methyltransferase
MEFLYDDLYLVVNENVYHPAEDSLMLADAAKGLKGNVLEVGSGSGLASLSAARSADSVLGVDINPEAVECARVNAERNSISNVEFKPSDLFSGVEGQFDTILFNPPYLPTADDEHVAGQLDKAFDGGKDGRGVLDRFLERFQEHLKPKGILLLVQSSLNDLEETEAKLSSMGFRTEVMGQQDFFFEKLFLLKAER